jgi:hypothetical protein
LRDVIDADAPVDVSRHLTGPLQRIARARMEAGQEVPLPRELLPIQRLAQPGGATFNGLQRARSTLQAFEGQPGYDTGDLRLMYGALSDALEDAAARTARTNPTSARNHFRAANTRYAELAERNRDIGNLLRTESDERLADRIIGMASDKGGANIRRFGELREAMGEPAFRELAGLSINRMGRVGDEAFSPAVFVTNWDKLSPAGRTALFGGGDSPIRRSMDDLVALSRRSRDVERRFGNPSGTARNTGQMAALAGFTVDPLSTLATLGGGVVLARALSRPATASSAARWARAYDRAVRQPSAATVATLRMASRNLSATLADQTGLNVAADDLMAGLVGQVPSRAGEENRP